MKCRCLSVDEYPNRKKEEEEPKSRPFSCQKIHTQPQQLQKKEKISNLCLNIRELRKCIHTRTDSFNHFDVTQYIHTPNPKLI